MNPLALGTCSGSAWTYSSPPHALASLAPWMRSNMVTVSGWTPDACRARMWARMRAWAACPRLSGWSRSRYSSTRPRSSMRQPRRARSAVRVLWVMSPLRARSQNHCTSLRCRWR
uniref:Uncharacterized protein n=1 Tax=uncultured marine virus TaxID=186617 RepID=A0A0F7L6A1_9VIRU|nr:hypothetical protein [uncultured marine virus]